MVAMLLFSQSVRAQFSVDSPSRDAGAEVPFEMSGSAAASGAPRFHIFPANTDAGRHVALSGPVGLATPQPAAVAQPLVALARPGFFPADLTNLSGGVKNTLQSAGSVNIYYNCADESCWGDPESFLSDLAVSRFIHVVDQYVGDRRNRRYPLAATMTATGSAATLTTSEVESIVHQAALAQGTGHIFHLFVPQGTDVCPDPGDCYSPDVPSTFTLCAYHSFTQNFSDTGVIFYTVQPFQDVTGCMLAPPNPNSALIDSTNSALSHELFETISDPMVNAWMAENSLPEQGNEMADICHGPGNAERQTVAPAYVLVKGHTYQTQLEYSNFRHRCVVSP
jgi:hypothetical protein